MDTFILFKIVIDLVSPQGDRNRNYTYNTHLYNYNWTMIRYLFELARMSEMVVRFHTKNHLAMVMQITHTNSLFASSANTMFLIILVALLQRRPFFGNQYLRLPFTGFFSRKRQMSRRRTVHFTSGFTFDFHRKPKSQTFCCARTVGAPAIFELAACLPLGSDMEPA